MSDKPTLLLGHEAQNDPCEVRVLVGLAVKDPFYRNCGQPREAHYLAPAIPGPSICIDCRAELSGLFFGAGDGRGQKFRCQPCHDLNESKRPATPPSVAQSLERAAGEMADLAMDLLSRLPEDEQERRISSLEQRAARLATPPPAVERSAEERVKEALAMSAAVHALQPLRDVLARWSEPCLESCSHAHCPLLRDVRQATVVAQASSTAITQSHARAQVEAVNDRLVAAHGLGLQQQAEIERLKALLKEASDELSYGMRETRDLRHRIEEAIK